MTPGAPALRDRLRLPLIAAPMLHVSGPDLVLAACRAGVIGAFPAANAGSPEVLDAWLARFEAAQTRARDAGQPWAPFCPNLIVNRPSVAQDLDCIRRHTVELVITSVGSPAPVVAPLHDAGVKVLADVASLRHAERAIAAGVDGLVLLTAGAGGQTGWLNPFAFVRAVRRMFDGLIVLAGGIGDGLALRAAEVLGCDLAYMGTRFIATRESLASDGYKRMLVEASMDDVVLTRAFTGLPTSFLRPSIAAAGYDVDALEQGLDPQASRRAFAEAVVGSRAPRRWRDVWSAGHSVSAVHATLSVAELVAEIEGEYRA